MIKKCETCAHYDIECEKGAKNEDGQCELYSNLTERLIENIEEILKEKNKDAL
jgi:hypothetical protein